MAAGAGHAHAPAAEARVPRVAWGVVAMVGAVVSLAWLVTWRTAPDHDRLLLLQLRGAAPTDALLFLALSGVMMVAMMLPSAAPMLASYRGLALRDAGPAEARVRTGLFATGYFVVWAAFTTLALVALAALGLMGGFVGQAVYVPGVLLVVAGAYQLTGWKQSCLRHCRTPTGFFLSQWRSGRRGAMRMGLAHAAYCLGCCWLLMLVLFTAGAMSLWWMAVFAGLILAEKMAPRGEGVARVAGVVALVAGVATLGLAWSAPPPPPAETPGMDGMGMPR